MSKLRAIVIAIFFLAFAVQAAEIKQINFVSTVSGVRPGQVSEPLKVQLQDGAGNETKAEDTVHLKVGTTLGEISSSDSNWKATDSLTLSKGTANRSFYFKSNETGTAHITVTALDQGWRLAELDLSVGDDSEVTTLDKTTGDSDESSNKLEPVKEKAKKVKLSLEKKIVALAGVPVTIIPEGLDPLGSVSCRWSFGDGTQGEGKEPSHAYIYPGKYIVVLSASGRESTKVRSAVEVISPEISIRSVENEGREIVLTNKSKVEINLGNWKLRGGNSEFTFPEDTIMGENTTLTFPTDVTGLKLWPLDRVELVSSSGKVFSAYEVKAWPINIDKQDQIKLRELYRELVSLEADLQHLGR